MGRGRRAVAILIGVVLFVGAGHTLVGRQGRGMVWSTACGVVLVSLPLSVWLLLVFLAIHLGHLIDLAVIRPGEAPPRGRKLAGLLVGGWLVTIAFLTGLQHWVVEPFEVPTSAMEPTLAAGERVLVDRTAYARGDLVRGDVVVLEHPCQDKRLAGRVVALGGDTVEIRCTILHVNGAPVPRILVDAGTSRWREHHPAGAAAIRLGRDQPRLEQVRRAAPDRRDYLEWADPLDFPRADAPPVASCDGATGTIVATPPPAEPCAPRAHYVVPAGHVFVLGDHRATSADSRAWGPVAADAIAGRVTGIWWGRFGDL